MRFGKKLATAALVAVVASATAVEAQIYVYNGGPNYVNMSGARCRAAISDQQPTLGYSSGGVRVLSTFVGQQTLYCPVTRRSTTTYQAGLGSESLWKNVTVSNLTVRAQDTKNNAALSCRMFITQLNGAISFSTNRYLCSTAGGCLNSSSGTFWTGINTLTWTNPIGTLQSVNWGLSCSVPPNSSIHHYEATVTPNT